MKEPKGRRPSPALAVAIVALVVASAGTATAASLVIRNSGQIKNGAVRSVDLANKKGVKVADLTPQARVALRGAGPQGPPGPAGSVSGAVTRLNTVTLADGAGTSTTAQCQGAEKLVGGGARLGNTDVDSSDLHLHSSRPAVASGAPPAEGAAPTGWRAFAWTAAGGPNTDSELAVYAICAS